MKFYVDTIEQIKGTEEGTFSEYGKREKVNSEQSALTKFYQALANVSASANHVYMDIKITNSEGGCIKRDQIGTYHEEQPQPEPQPEPETEG